ncbi:hypothetical protein ABID58_004735 [Bradyrhizobium sp. S3.2.6]
MSPTRQRDFVDSAGHSGQVIAAITDEGAYQQDQRVHK